MRIGALLMPTDPWATTVDSARRLESLGYHHLWVYDHLSWQRYHDRPWHATAPWLAGVAAATDRIRLGTMVSNLNVRHPVVLAKDAMTLDHISNGRFILGLGAAGTGYDAVMLGQRRLSPAERIDRLGEAVPLIDGLLRGTIHDHSGDFYEVVDARVLPGCVQSPRVPLAIAAGGPRALRITAEHGDAWITYGDTSHRATTPEATERIVTEQSHRLTELCAEVGRDPGEIDRIFLIGNDQARPLASLAAFEDFVGRYRELGFTDIVFHAPRDDDPVWNDPPEIVEQVAHTFLQ